MTLAIKLQIMNEPFYVQEHSVELRCESKVSSVQENQKYGELAQLVRATES